MSALKTTIWIPRRSTPAFGEAERPNFSLGGTFDPNVLRDDAHAHGHEVQVRKMGDSATNQIVEIDAVPITNLPTDTNQ